MIYFSLEIENTYMHIFKKQYKPGLHNITLQSIWKVYWINVLNGKNTNQYKIEPLLI